MSLAPSADQVARALLHVAERLGDRPGYSASIDVFSFSCAASWARARWMTLWALTAAYPHRSPVGWAPVLGLDPGGALGMLGYCRGRSWWNWPAVVEAVVILAGDA